MATKQEEIARLKNRHAKELTQLGEVPTIIFDNFSVFFAWGELIFSCREEKQSLEDLQDWLSKTKNLLGTNYTLNHYWLPYDGCLMVKYQFGDYEIQTGIKTDDPQSLLDKLSVGKCKVVTRTSQSIECTI